MQYSASEAATDQTAATLLAYFPGGTAPLASDFSVGLDSSETGAVTAVAPYGDEPYYLLRVGPAAIRGNGCRLFRMHPD